MRLCYSKAALNDDKMNRMKKETYPIVNFDIRSDHKSKRKIIKKIDEPRQDTEGFRTEKSIRVLSQSLLT